ARDAIRMSQDQGIERIRRLARVAERRIRFIRALREGSLAICIALGVAILESILYKLGVVSARSARVFGSVVAAFVMASALVAWTRRLPPYAGARALDRFHGL